MSTSIPDSPRLLALEKQAEQWALTILRGATFTDCLKINGIASACEIVTPEGKTVTIRGSDVYDHRTWKKFLASVNQDEDIYQLTDVKEHLAEQYKTWLLREHTARYLALATEADLEWLERVITLAVTRHIMEQKYAAYKDWRPLRIHARQLKWAICFCLITLSGRLPDPFITLSKSQHRRNNSLSSSTRNTSAIYRHNHS